jgi:hypothetical protein
VERLRKAANVDAEVIGGELVVMSTDDRAFVVLNEAGAALWDALDHLRTRPELLALLAEAFPDRPAAELAASLDAVLAALVGTGCVTAEPERA